MTQTPRLPARRIRLTLAALAPLVLAGCLAATTPASDRITLAEEGVTLAAPAGFCVDPKTSRKSREGAFVIFANCAAISGDPAAPRPAQPAILSATVGPQSPGPVGESFAPIEDFFRSEAGRAALARSGEANDVKILKTQVSDGLLLIKLRDGSVAEGAPVEPVYWRAITGLGGRITALSVLPLQGTQMQDASQIEILRAFAARSQQLSAPRAGS